MKPPSRRADDATMDGQRAWDGRERRAHQPLVYRPAELVGLASLRLRRRRDRLRLALHVGAVVTLLVLVPWWTLLPHGFAGPVVLSFTPERGVHLGDLVALAFVAAAGRSAVAAVRLARTR